GRAPAQTSRFLSVAVRLRAAGRYTAGHRSVARESARASFLRPRTHQSAARPVARRRPPGAAGLAPATRPGAAGWRTPAAGGTPEPGAPGPGGAVPADRRAAGRLA